MELHEHHCCDKQRVYKGSWTPHEDALLSHYMRAHGHQRPPWKNVPKYAGLLRCGKSCRFRWLHYLSPTLNREHFTIEEIELICNMQKTKGNKWAEIVKFLPGRSDNSIKNMWNKHHKKMINTQKNPTSPAIDLQSQQVFHSPETNISSTGENFNGYMSGFGVHHHGDSFYDLITLNNNTHAYMMPISLNSSTTTNQYTLPTNNNPTFDTSPINHHNNFQDDKSSFINYDLPPIPDSFSSQFDNTLLVPTWDTKATYYHSLFNVESSSCWIEPSSSYNQVLEKHKYHESNHLYDPSLLVPQDPNYQLMGDPLFGVTSRELNNQLYQEYFNHSRANGF